MTQARKLRNLAIIPGMGDLIGSMGVEVLNDIANSYSDMYEALNGIIDKFESEPVQCNGECETGLFCGLEDVDITDRYQACRYGYDKALDKVREWLIDGLDEVLAKADGKS